MADTQGWQFETLLNYTRIENEHEVRKKMFVFYYVSVICTITKRKKDTGVLEPLWSIRLKCHINDEARNEAHIASTRVRLY